MPADHCSLPREGESSPGPAQAIRSTGQDAARHQRCLAGSRPGRAWTAPAARGLLLPHSGHDVVTKPVWQYGQTAPVSNVSKALPHWEQVQKAPAGGAVRQVGHANPSRRGALATRISRSAYLQPAPAVEENEHGNDAEPQILRHQGQQHEGRDADEAEDRHDGQAPGAPEHEPQQRAAGSARRPADTPASG